MSQSRLSCAPTEAPALRAARADRNIASLLAQFIVTNREQIIARTRERLWSRAAPKPGDAELTDGIPLFVDQLQHALLIAESSDVIDHDTIRKSAKQHGRDLLRMGLSIAQVVHDYGDVCQAVTELAVQQHTAIPSDEFRALNLCLDDAIAEAVTEYTSQREQVAASDGAERLGALAHEMRNLLNTAMLAFESIKTGRVPANGSTSLVLSRSLLGLRDLVHRSLADVRLDAGIDRHESIGVADLVAEVEIGTLIQAQGRGLTFSSTIDVDSSVMVVGDRQILAAALANLLDNAFKFTPRGGTIQLTTTTTEDRVLFEVEDECGGLPSGNASDLFRPFAQAGTDRSGMGLGLAICCKAATANGGEVRARDLPGKGCVFTLDLPRMPAPRGALARARSGVSGTRR